MTAKAKKERISSTIKAEVCTKNSQQHNANFSPFFEKSFETHEWPSREFQLATQSSFCLNASMAAEIRQQQCSHVNQHDNIPLKQYKRIIRGCATIWRKKSHRSKILFGHTYSHKKSF